MNFKYDFLIFIGDCKNADKSQYAWCDNFVYYLNLLLQRMLGREMNYYTCTDENHLYDIKKQLKETAIFIILLSSNTKDSEILTSITRLIDEQYHLREYQRIYKIRKSFIEPDEQPNVLRKLLSYDFFINQNNKNFIVQAKEHFANEEEKLFWFNLLDLSFEIQKELKNIQTDKEILDVSKTIYLAETTEDQKINRDMIKRELIRHGYKIFPDKVLSQNKDSLEKEIESYLSLSVLSVHILGGYYGETVSGSAVSLVDMQNKVAADFYQKTRNAFSSKEEIRFSRVIWLPPDVQLNDEQQRIYIHKLKFDQKALKGADVLEIPVELLKNLIIKQCGKNVNMSDTPPNIKKAKQNIYILYDRLFPKNVQQIIDYLENKAYEVIQIIEKDSKIEMMNLHRQNLVRADAILIIYNNKNPMWLQSKVLDVLKAPGYGKKTPFKVVGYISDEKVTFDGLGYEKLMYININRDIENAFTQFFDYLEK